MRYGKTICSPPREKVTYGEITIRTAVLRMCSHFSGQGDARWTVVPKQGHPPAYGSEGET